MCFLPTRQFNTWFIQCTFDVNIMYVWYFFFFCYLILITKSLRKSHFLKTSQAIFWGEDFYHLFTVFYIL